MKLNETQRQQRSELLNHIHKILNEEIEQFFQNYKADITNDLETRSSAEKLLSYYYLKQICRDFLYHPQDRKFQFMPYVNDTDEPTTNHLLAKNPKLYIQLFNRPSFINDYIQLTRFNDRFAFLHDEKFNEAYEEFQRN